jgi:iron complex outermembrane recepter protein
LKGAAASALYGIDGARGVILVTTKKGNKKGKGLTVEYSTTYTTSQVTNLPALQTKFGKGSLLHRVHGDQNWILCFLMEFQMSLMQMEPS